MTYDTPGETEGDQRWCEHCQLAVEPVGDMSRLWPCGRLIAGREATRSPKPI